MACKPDNVAPPGTDKRLFPFLNAPTEEEAERALRRLVARYAEPVIDGVVRRHFPRPCGRVETEERNIAESVRSDSLIKTLRRLRLLRSGIQTAPIADFGAYVAVTAFHVCDHALRRLHPKRHHLKLKILRLLSETPGLAVWDANGIRLAGFAPWQRKGYRPDARRLRAFLAGGVSPSGLPRTGSDPRSAPLADVLADLLDAAGCPIPLEDLVDFAAKVLGIREAVTVSLTVQWDCEEGERVLVDSSPSVESRVELRDYLMRLWEEIVDLPFRQRNALLLNLRGEQGRDGVALFLLSDIASREAIAKTLGMASHEISELWDGLPLDDEAIAERLGCTRAQVIGLRSAARHRLQRRMAAQDRVPGLIG